MQKVNALVYYFDAGFRVSMVWNGLPIFCYGFLLCGSRENSIIFDRNSVTQNRVQTTNPSKSCHLAFYHFSTENLFWWPSASSFLLFGPVIENLNSGPGGAFVGYIFYYERRSKIRRIPFGPYLAAPGGGHPLPL